MFSWLRGKRGYRYWLTLGASMVLGLVFVTAGVGKLVGQSAFLLNIQSVSFFPPIFVAIIGYWLPWAELVLGLLLIAGVFTQLVALVSTALVAAFIFHNSWMISQGSGYEPCGCLGAFDKLFEGKLSTIGSLYVDIGLLILAVVVYFGYQGRFFALRPWFLRRGSMVSGSSPDTESDNSTKV